MTTLSHREAQHPIDARSAGSVAVAANAVAWLANRRPNELAIRSDMLLTFKP
jgi:hypothetical protein